MFGFATPAWLVALSALALPIALHLWSQRPRQVVRIGSLRHLRGPEGPRAWGRRLEDLPLLGLRLAILLAVCLALAGLWGRGRTPGTGAAETLVLADPAVVSDSLRFFADPVVDSLRRTGTPIHLLLAGMPRLGSGPFQGTAPVGGLWSRLTEADHATPSGAAFLVISNLAAGELGGARPDLSRPVRWREIGTVQGKPQVVAHWPAGSDTTIRLMSWRRGMVSFRYLDSSAEAGAPRVAAGTVESDAGFWADLNGRSVSELHLEVVADKQDTPEVLTAVAAFSAAGEAATGGTWVSAVVHPDSMLRGAFRPDLIVWLSGQSITDFIRDQVRQGSTLVEFTAVRAGGHEHLLLASAGGVGLPPTRQLMRLGDVPVGAPLLTDQFGRAIVSVTKSGTGRHYRVATRLDPAWSDLALGPALPELAYWIVTGQADRAAAAPVSPAQAAPTGLSHDLPANPPPRRLASTMLLLAGFLLLAERLVVHAGRGTAPA